MTKTSDREIQREKRNGGRKLLKEKSRDLRTKGEEIRLIETPSGKFRKSNASMRKRKQNKRETILADGNNNFGSVYTLVI